MPNIKKELEKLEKQVKDFLADNDFSEQQNKDWCASKLKYAIVYHKLAEAKGGSDHECTREEFGNIYSAEWQNNPMLIEMVRDIEDPKKLEGFIKNPKDFLDEYESKKLDYPTEQQVRNDLNRFAEEKDYDSMVNYCMDICAENNMIKEQAVEDYFYKLMLKNGKKGQQLTEKNRETIEGFWEAVSNKLANEIIKAENESEKYAQNVRSGAYPETFLFDKDPGMPEKLGQQMMFNFSEPGKTLEKLGLVQNFVRGAGSHAKCKLDEMTIGSYLEKSRMNTCKKVCDKNAPQLSEQIQKPAFIAGYTTPPKSNRSIKGFVIKSDAPNAGESVFASLPKGMRKAMEMTDEDLLIREQAHLNRAAFLEEEKNRLKDMLPPAKKLLDELNAANNPNKKSEDYLELLAELENFQKFGKKGYLHGGYAAKPDANNMDKEDGILSPGATRNALKRLADAAGNYAKENPAFADKVQGFVWAQKQKFNNYLVDKNTDIPLDIVERVKKHRNLEGKKPDADMRYVNNMTKVPEMLAAAKKKFKDGKLLGGLRGSNQYRRIGDAMEKLEDRLAYLIKHEKRIRKDGMEDEDRQRSLMHSMKQVQEEISKLKETTAEYFAHKGKDGQWKKGTNENADRRIEAAQALDAFADFLGDTIGTQIKALDASIPLLSQKKIAEDRKKLESKKPDYETWSELYPKSTDAYKNANEEIPFGVKEFEEKLNTAKDFLRCTELLSIPMSMMGHEEEFNKLSSTTSKLNRRLYDRNTLDHFPKPVTAEVWNSEVPDYLNQLKKQFCDGDNYTHIAEAADKHGPFLKTDLHQKVVAGIGAINEIFKIDIPVAELEKKYQFHKEKQSFREQAADIYVRNVHRQEVEAYLQQHPEYNTDKLKQQVYEMNPISDEWRKEKTELLLKDDAFNAFIGSIKSMEDLKQVKQMAENGNGAELYDHIRYAKYKPVDLDAKLTAAQKRLNDKKAQLAENEYPDKQAAEQDYAEITAVHLLKKKANDAHKEFTVKDFEDTVKDLREEPFFKEGLIGGKLTAESAFKKAVTGNGKDIYFEAGNAKTEFKKLKANEAKLNAQKKLQNQNPVINNEVPGKKN